MVCVDLSGWLVVALGNFLQARFNFLCFFPLFFLVKVSDTQTSPDVRRDVIIITVAFSFSHNAPFFYESNSNLSSAKLKKQLRK